MDSGMIGKIEKAIRYAQERDRFTISEFLGTSAWRTQYAHRFVRRWKTDLHLRVLWNARRVQPHDCDGKSSGRDVAGRDSLSHVQITTTE